MRDSEVYAQAAKLMEDGNRWVTGSCCWAIQLAKNPNCEEGNHRADPHCKAMKRVYAPHSRDAYWMGDNLDPTANEVRILALCFMSTLAAGKDWSLR
jgi:hypothetical protein